MVFNLEVVAIVISIIWLSVLTILYSQLFSHYNKLTHGISSKTLKSILDHVLSQLENMQKDIETLKKNYATIEKDGALHIQKVGLLRFNPFKDTGGDQSFVLALTNVKDTGIVISGLYSRSGTRWYAKRIKEGKGVDHELSEEEKKAIKAAN